MNISPTLWWLTLMFQLNSISRLYSLSYGEKVLQKVASSVIIMWESSNYNVNPAVRCMLDASCGRSSLQSNFHLLLSVKYHRSWHRQTVILPFFEVLVASLSVGMPSFGIVSSKSKSVIIALEWWPLDRAALLHYLGNDSIVGVRCRVDDPEAVVVHVEIHVVGLGRVEIIGTIRRDTLYLFDRWLHWKGGEREQDVAVSNTDFWLNIR